MCSEPIINLVSFAGYFCGRMMKPDYLISSLFHKFGAQQFPSPPHAEVIIILIILDALTMAKSMLGLGSNL